MTKFKIGDVVRLKTDEPYKVPLIVKEFLFDSVRCKSECGRRCAWAAIADLELIERRDPQADMKQVIREVLLSDEFMTAFAAAFCSATVLRSTLEHLIPGVNRPMRNEAQLSKMVETVGQSLTTESNSPKILGSSSESIDHRQKMTDRMSNLTLLCKEAKTDAVSLAMKIACERFGGSDGVFNGAGFSGAIRTLSGLNFDLDGFIVATILCGRTDVEVLKGGSHYRHLQTESTEIESNCPETLDSSSEPWTPKVGEKVRLIETGRIYEIGSYSETHAQYSMQGWPRSCVNLEDIEPANSPGIPVSGHYCDAEPIWVDEPNPFEGRNEKNADKISVSGLVECLSQAMQNDQDLAWVWHCNIAAGLLYEGVDHKTANLAAARFMSIAFGVDMTSFKEWKRFDWVACRKIEVTSSPTKRYRTPTLSDLANGSIACEYRGCDDEHWRGGFLVHILNGAIPFLCVDEQWKLSGQWDQCRIEVTDDPA